MKCLIAFSILISSVLGYAEPQCDESALRDVTLEPHSFPFQKISLGSSGAMISDFDGKDTRFELTDGRWLVSRKGDRNQFKIDADWTKKINEGQLLGLATESPYKCTHVTKNGNSLSFINSCENDPVHHSMVLEKSIDPDGMNLTVKDTHGQLKPVVSSFSVHSKNDKVFRAPIDIDLAKWGPSCTDNCGLSLKCSAKFATPPPLSGSTGSQQ